jgi:class 3 adenylate cyclase/tetratricopeptide (TPR) repeat protein
LASHSDSNDTDAAGAARIALETFLPADRRRTILDGTDLPRRMFGAALFVDLTGFTSLTDRLVRQYGARLGAERLSEELGTLFEMAVATVHRHGGSVIGFAGDAITCWFAGRDGVLGAVAAASEAQAQANMPVKLVVTSGFASRFLVGDPDIQVLEVLAGAVVDRLGVVEQLARPGEVLVGGEILGWLGDRARFEWRRDDLALADRRTPEGESFAVIRAHSLPPPAPMTAWPPSGIAQAIARRWVPPTVYSRIVRGEEAFISELRMTTTLFLRFGGIDYETDDKAHEKLDLFIRRVQRTVHDLGGHLLEIVVGDKGSYLYATFGATAAHEDDTHRAVIAARRIVAGSVDDTTTGMAAGVSQGITLCGVYGGSERRTYGALGKAANEAARLMQAAPPGAVLVTDRVAASVGSSFVTAPLDEPIGGATAFQVVGGRTRLPFAGASAAMVGRAGELGRLRDWIADAQADRGRMGVLVGEPGMGKSRLLTELATQARAAGLLVATSRGSEIEASTPYHIWKEIFEDLLGLEDASTEAETLFKLEPLVSGTEFQDLLPLLSPVLPTEIGATARTPALSTLGTADRTRDLMLHCIEALHPSVLIFDDGQWIDSASHHLISLAAKNFPWLLAVIALRSSTTASPAEPQLVDLAGVDGILRLDALADGEIVEVVRQLLGVDSVPDELGSLLVDRSGGNPFYAEELARALVQDGLIAVDGRKAALRGSHQELRRRIPETVTTRVQARLSALPEDLEATVLVASLLGQEFSLRLLVDVHPSVRDAGRLANQLKDLVQAGVIEQDESSDAAYRFSHSLIREAAVGLSITDTARHIHRRAAEWIERTHSDLSGWSSVLAYHWTGAEVAAKAIRYEAAAAERALTSGAYSEAVAGFRRALELYGEDQALASSLEAATWHMLLGEARVFQQGEDERQARGDLIRGLELIGEAPARVVPYPAAAIARAVEQTRNHWFGRRPTASPEKVERFRLAARAYEQLVEVFFLANDDFASLHASLQALNLAEKAGAPAELARGFATVGAVVGLIPRPKLADRYLRRAEEAAATTEDPRAVMWVALVRGFYYAGVARWRVAEESSARGRDLAAQLGDRRRLEDGLAALMVENWFQGRLVAAEAFANEIHHLAQRRQARRSQAYAAQGRAYVHVEMGDVERAAAAIGELEGLGYELSGDDQAASSRPDDRALACDTLALRSLTHLRSGQVDQALRDARLLMRRMQGVRPFNFSAFMAYNAAAEVMVMAAVREPRLAVSDQELHRAIKLSAAYARIFPVGRSRPLLWRGMLRARQGRTESALAEIRKAAEAARSQGMLLDEARALYELGRLGAEGTEEAEAITAHSQAMGVARTHGGAAP